MKAFDTKSGQRRLFLFAHPDDEIALACWIRSLTERGEEVHLGWMHSTPIRESEARKGARRLGVHNHRFFGAPDGSLVDVMADYHQPLVDWISEVKPTVAYTGAFEQGHLDHDATHWLLRQAFSGTIFEAPLYHPYVSRFPIINRYADPTGEEILTLSSAEMQFKKRYAQGFPSQNIWRNLVAAEVRSRGLAATERLRLVQDWDYRVPQLPKALSARVQKSKKWARWLAGLEAASRQLS